MSEENVLSTQEHTAIDNGLDSNDATSSSDKQNLNDIPKDSSDDSKENVNNNSDEIKSDSEDQESKEEDPSDIDKAPENYEDFKLPKDVSFDDEVLDKFTSLAKEMNLSQEKAQKFIDLATDSFSSDVLKQQKYWSKIRKDWIEDLKKDDDFGGSNYNETIVRAKRTLKNYGSDDLLSFLDNSGFIDNGEVLKLLAKVDKSIGEGNNISGQPVRENSKSSAQVMYPNGY